MGAARPERGARRLGAVRPLVHPGVPVPERSRQLPAGADAELGEDLPQVPFDGAGTEEQRGADLGIGRPLRREPGDLRLLRGEVARGLHRALADRLPGGEYRAGKLPKTLKLDGEAYVRTENPLGLMAYYLIGNGKKQPYRLKMRTASFSNVSVLPAMLPGTLVPDLIAILGSVFFVVGDVDR